MLFKFSLLRFGLISTSSLLMDTCNTPSFYLLYWFVLNYLSWILILFNLYSQSDLNLMFNNLTKKYIFIMFCHSQHKLLKHVSKKRHRHHVHSQAILLKILNIRVRIGSYLSILCRKQMKLNDLALTSQLSIKRQGYLWASPTVKLQYLKLLMPPAVASSKTLTTWFIIGDYIFKLASGLRME